MNDKWIIRFTAEIINENTDNIDLESGLIVAGSLSEAAAQIEGYYGPTINKITDIHYVLDSPFVWGTPEVIDELEKHLC